MVATWESLYRRMVACCTTGCSTGGRDTPCPGRGCTCTGEGRPQYWVFRSRQVFTPHSFDSNKTVSLYLIHSKRLYKHTHFNNYFFTNYKAIFSRKLTHNISPKAGQCFRYGLLRKPTSLLTLGDSCPI